MVAKLTKEPKQRKLKDGEAEKPLSPVSRSTIKQALRIKCNSVICNLRKKVYIVGTATQLIIDNKLYPWLALSRNKIILFENSG